MRRLRSAPRGFSIIEIIVALVIVGVLGTAVTKLILGQARSFQSDNGARRARSTSRSAMNILVTDLRMTQDVGGVSALDATNNQRVEVRVPLVFGIVCEVTASNVVIGLVSADSFQLATAKYGGYAVRSLTTGSYGYSAAGTGDTITSTGSGRCHSGGVSIFADTITAGGRPGRVVVASPGPPAGTVVGAPAFVWQTVVYEFKNSGMYPGSKGLYREIRGRGNSDVLTEELLAPFASTARFSYYSIPAQVRDAPDSVAPAVAMYDSLRGFRIVLPAQAPDTVPGRTGPQTATTTTAVFFKNTRVQ